MPSTLSAAALGLAPPPQLDVSAAAPLELHRLDVVKTLGDSTYTWMQGDCKLDQINLRYRDVLTSMLCFTPFRTALKQFFDQLTGEGAGRRSKGAGRRGDDGARLEMASAPSFAKKA